MTRPAGTERLPLAIWLLITSGLFRSAATVGLVTIVGKQAFDMTGSNLTLGLLGLAEFVPTLLLAPLSGPIADRFDRRLISVVMSIGLALVGAVLFVYVSTDPTSVGPIYVVMIVFGIVRAFLLPAIRALPVDLASPAILERTVALTTLSRQFGVVIGPLVAGFVFTVDIALPYVIIAGAYLLCGVVLFAIPSSGVSRLLSRPGGRQAIRDAVEGFRYVRRAPIVGGAIVLDLFAVLLGGAVALLPSIAETRLGVDAIGLGWLRAALGVGAGLVTLVLAVVPLRRLVGRVLLASVAVFGVATIVLGLTTNFVVALVALLVLGGSDSVSVFIRSTLVPMATPEAMRGRVLALESVFIGASNELGAFESGVTAALFGLVGAVVFGGVGTLAVVGGFWLLFPALRDVDRFADARPPEEVGGNLGDSRPDP